MSKKTNSINLRSRNSVNLSSNVFFEKYNYSKLLYQDFYIRDYLKNILRYNFYDSIVHKIVIQRKKDIIFIFLDYYLLKKKKRKRSRFKVFSLKRKFWWYKKKKIYRKYFSLYHIFKKRYRLKYSLPKKKKNFFKRKTVPVIVKKKKRKSLYIRTPLIRLNSRRTFSIFSFKRFVLLNLMLLTNCRVKLYTKNIRRFLNLPFFIKQRKKKRNRREFSSEVLERTSIAVLIKRFRIKSFVSKIKTLNVPLLLHLTYVSFAFKNPEILGGVLSKILKRNIKTFRNFNFFIKRTLLALYTFSNLDGLKIQFKGRLGKSLRKKTSIIQFGQMPLQSISLNIKYSFSEAITIYGCCGIKVWYYYSVK
jgi:hypothetical protein